MGLSKDELEVIIHRLSCHIPQFYLVGGVSRAIYTDDYTKISDVDIVTGIPLEILKKKLRPSFFKGKEVSTLEYLHGKSRVEIAGFRANSIEEDLCMRDVTMNSIAYEVREGIVSSSPIDPAGGRDDIHFGILRTFRETNIVDDPLRILRIFRFASSTGFEIDLNTLKNMTDHKELLSSIPPERINKEISGILLGKNCVKTLRLMAYSGILGVLIPEIKQIEDFMHIDRYHKNESVFEHSLRVMGNCENDIEMKLAALFHDMGKPATANKIKAGSYIGHESVGSDIAREIMMRLRLPSKTVHNVSEIIKNHMIHYESEKVVRKFAFNADDALYYKTMNFIKADKIATGREWLNRPEYLEYVKNINIKSRERTLLLKIKESIDGNILIGFGMVPGPWMKRIINYVYNFYLEKPSRIDAINVKILLEKELLFRGVYGIFSFGKISCARKKEYYKDGIIYGVLESGMKLDIKTGIFEFHYLEEEDLNLWLKENSKYSSSFSA